MKSCATCGTPLIEARPTRRRFCSEQCRKAQYAGTCVDCGAPTNGYDGPGKASERCLRCRHRFERENAYWTRERIIAAYRRWVAEHGHQPTADDWRIRNDGYWPSSSTVLSVLGSWNAATRAAGMQPLQEKGGPEDFERTRALYESGLSVAEVAEREDRDEVTIYWRLAKLGVPLRHSVYVEGYTAQQRQQAIDAYLAGATLARAAATIGASQFAVWNWMNQAGIPRRSSAKTRLKQAA